MTEMNSIRNTLWICSIVAVFALLIFAGTTSAFTYNSDDYSVSPTGTVTPGTSVTASMTILYSDGSKIPNQINLDSDLSGVSWTVVRNPGQSNSLTLHPAYPYDYVSNFDLYEASGPVSVKVTVTGTVSSKSAGKSISPLIISEDGGSGTIYESPSLDVAGSSTTTTPTTVVSTATTVATATSTQSLVVSTAATKTPHPTLSQPTSSPSASKSTFDSTVLIIIICALVAIIAGTVIIVRLTKRPKKTEQTVVTKVEQKDIHVTVNGNVYSDVGVVASDNAVVNRATLTNDAKKVCPYCGAEMKKDDKYCGKCGKEL